MAAVGDVHSITGAVCREASQLGCDDPVRCSVFEPDGLTLIADKIKKKRGRPANSWATSVLPLAVQAAGGTYEKLSELLRPGAKAKRTWRSAVVQYCSNL